MHYCCRVFGVIVLEVDESVLVFGFRRERYECEGFFFINQQRDIYKAQEVHK